MFSEEELREAAAEYNAAMVKALLRDYDPEQQHVFSPQYDRKIKRLQRRADHPVFYRVLRSAAALLLSLLIGGGALLAVSPTARAAFVGWVKEVWEEFFLYHFEGDSVNVHQASNNKSTTELEHYYLARLPEGYEKYFIAENSSIRTITYTNNLNQMLKFSYSHTLNVSDLYIAHLKTTMKQININGVLANLLIANYPKDANAIIWKDEDDTVFYISGHISEQELILIAENVKIAN